MLLWQFYRKAWHFWGYTYSKRFDMQALFILFTVTKIGIKSWTYSCDYFFYNFRCGLIQFLATKLLQGPVFIYGMVHSTEVEVYSNTNFVKVIQNELLFRKPLMLCANWYCKIVIWLIVRLGQRKVLVGPAWTIKNWFKLKHKLYFILFAIYVLIFLT